MTDRSDKEIEPYTNSVYSDKFECTVATFRNLSIENLIKDSVIYFWESHKQHEEDDDEKIQATVDLISKKFDLLSCEKYEIRTGYLSRYNYLLKPINEASSEEIGEAINKGEVEQREWIKRYGDYIKPLGFMERDWQECISKEENPSFDSCKELIKEKLENNETFYDAFSKSVDDYILKHNTDKTNGNLYVIEENAWILSLPLLHLNKPIYLIHVGNDNSAIRTLFNQFPSLQAAVKWLSPHFNSKVFVNRADFQLEYRNRTNFGYSYAIANKEAVSAITQFKKDNGLTKEDLLRVLQQERSEKELLSTIIGKIPGHVYWLNRDNVYLGCNELQAQHFGLKSRNEVIGKTNYDLSVSKEAKRLNKINKEVMEEGKTYKGEELATMYNGFGYYLSHKTPLFDTSGKVVGLLGISIDITDRKKAEQLQKEKEVVEKISKALEMLSGCIAHEIRTPLAGINVNVDNLRLVLDKLPLDSSNTEQINKIKNFAANIKLVIKNGRNIIDMLLVKLRCVLNKQIDNQRLASHSIKSCINDAIKEYPFDEAENDIVVWDEQVNEDFTYVGDNLLTKHILFNLIKNALRAIKEVDRGKIYFGLKCDKKFNYLIFRDTASGIPVKVLNTLFHQFSSGSRDGAGLGLAFCKMVMQSYNGDITCDTKEGEYTEFTLNFPAITDKNDTSA